MKQFPVQVEDHLYVRGGETFPDTLQVKLTGEDACFVMPGGLTAMATTSDPKGKRTPLIIFETNT